MAKLNRFVVAAAMIASVDGNGNAAFMATRPRQRTNSFDIALPTSKMNAPRHCVMTPPSKMMNLLRSELSGVEDVFLLSIDGTLATTSRSRSIMAISVALKVWPTLISSMEALNMKHEVFDLEHGTQFQCRNDDEGQYEWLLQKLSALSSITQQGNNPDAMLGCDEVLMVRLLLEEQLLDGGRSNGRGGKYGGKFHPSTTSSSSAEGRGKSIVGSRPLTVGELYANWSELRDVTRMKYPFMDKDSNGKERQLDPLSHIRQYLREIVSMPSQGERYSWISLAFDVLFDNQCGTTDGKGSRLKLRQNTMLLLGHDAQIPSMLNALTLLGNEFDIESDVIHLDDDFAKAMFDGFVPSTQENSAYNSKIKVVVTTSAKAQERLGQGLLLVVPDLQNVETHSNMIERIVFDFCERSQVTKNISVIHSSLEVLKQCKPFLGEDAYVHFLLFQSYHMFSIRSYSPTSLSIVFSPILHQGLRKCVLPRANMAVTLYLPEWAENVHISQMNDGEMDPRMNILSEEQLLELISARITVAS
jgi:hypothetical protein